jgi:hypothetical protein
VYVFTPPEDFGDVQLHATKCYFIVQHLGSENVYFQQTAPPVIGDVDAKSRPFLNIFYPGRKTII